MLKLSTQLSDEMAFVFDMVCSIRVKTIYKFGRWKIFFMSALWSKASRMDVLKRLE